ncbi:signal peptidase I [Sphingobacteriales bacterium CHB3]|nr:signal peptidase I [Sphingobacteriales bacterium CHB3]
MAKEVTEKSKVSASTAVGKTKDFFKDFVFVLGAFLILNSMVLAAFEVPTGSMENEIMAGDFLFVNKFIYGGSTPRTIPLTNIRVPWFRVTDVVPFLKWRDVERGDVIVFEFPGQRDEAESPEFMFYLKRCIALSGDTVLIRDRHVYVNGKHVDFPRNVKFNSPRIIPAGVADPRIFPKGEAFNEDNWGPVIVPSKGDVITLSRETLDRWKTFIEREGSKVGFDGEGRITIDGTPTQRYVVKRDYAFGMGDNRDNSLDGRFWGFIPKESIVGSPLIVYWSWNPDFSIFSDPINKLATIRFNRIGMLIK